MSDELEPQEQTPESFLLVSIVLELGLGAFAILLGVIFGPDPRDLVPQWYDYSAIASGIGWGLLAALPMVGAVQLLEKLPLKAIEQLREITEERLIKMMVELRISELGIVSICAGVGEELLFRGWLMMVIAGPAVGWDWQILAMAIAVSSIAFGFAHPVSPIYVIVTAIMGVFFALLLVWTQNLLVPIVAHAAYDFIELVLATRELRKKDAAVESVD